MSMRFHIATVIVGFGASFASLAASDRVFVTDDVGRSIHVQTPAIRIVALEPFLTELVFAVGAGRQLVGVSFESRFPVDTFSIPKVRNAATFMIEQMAQMKPDLVLAWAESIDPDEVERISSSGTNIFVAQSRRLDDVPRLLGAIGTMTGHDASAIADTYTRRLDQLRALNAKKVKVSAFVEIRHRPLTTISSRHFLSDALEICRAENVFSTQVAITPEVYWEQVFRRSPQVIVGFGSASNAEEFERNWSVRRGLDAVRTERLVFVDSEVIQQPTTRTPEQVLQLCERIDRVRP